MCMFKHSLEVNEEAYDNEDNAYDGDNDDAIEDESDKIRVFAPCRDKHLANDQKYYRTELEKLNEISKVKKYMYIQSQVMRSEMI